VYKVCSFLPAMGLLTAFLPNIETAEQRRQRKALLSLGHSPEAGM